MKYIPALALAALLPLAGRCAEGPASVGVRLREYVSRFNAEDREVHPTSLSNQDALAFLQANVPLFECPDRDIEQTYYFRWWTFRKHLKQSPDGWVITEFLPPVPWAGKHNTINCASGHHVREGRWLRDRRPVEDYIRHWFRKDVRSGYSSWLPEAVWAYCTTIGDYTLAKELLPELIRHYRMWETSRLDKLTGLYAQNDNGDGMEGSISGGGFRPTINAYMFANATAIARIAERAGQPALADEYRGKAATLKKLVQERLWNAEHAFFEVRQAPQPMGLLGVRVNNDAELTKRARPSSSSKQDAGCLTRDTMPRNSWVQNEPHVKFTSPGALEWVQYEFSEPVEMERVQLFLLRMSMRMEFPESVRVLYRADGAWKEVADAKGTLDRYDRWNAIAFKPVTTDALKIELRLAGYTRDALPLQNVRELLGYVPWMFDLPDPQYAVAWKQFADPQGFAAPWGLTTAEQRHPRYEISYTRHECLWNGPVWPFATAQTLTALANLLNGPPQDHVDRRAYFEALRTYARSHQFTLPDGRTVPWIDENQNPTNGDWIARTRLIEHLTAKPEAVAKKGPMDRGRDYNHSTFCDLVINGLVGLRPRSDDVVEVNPLLPPDAWDWFRLDRVPYHGHELTILWDRTGTRYGKGVGLRVFADGKEIAAAETLTRVTSDP